MLLRHLHVYAKSLQEGKSGATHEGEGGVVHKNRAPMENKGDAVHEANLAAMEDRMEAQRV